MIRRGQLLYERTRDNSLSRTKHLLYKLKLQEDIGMLLLPFEEKKLVQAQKVNLKEKCGCAKSPKDFPTSCTENFPPH